MSNYFVQNHFAYKCISVVFSAIPLCIIPVFSFLFAQDGAVIQGTVSDKSTGEPLPDATIVVLESNIGDVADSTGFYQILPLPAGKYSLKASMIGYESEIIPDISIQPDEQRTINFVLQPNPVRLREVRVEAERHWDKYLTEASLVGVTQLAARQLLRTPAAFDDVLRAVQIKGGVSGPGDYSGYFSVHGGGANQNLVVVDDVVIPNPYRFRAAFGGGLSDINPNTVQDAYLHRGGYSTEFGNALSSVLEIDARAGRESFSFQGNLNLTDMNGLIEGPFPGINGSYLFSARRTYYDFLANTIAGGSSSFPFYFEMLGKMTFNINANNRILVSLKRSREGAELLEDVTEEINISENANTFLGSVTWRTVAGENWRFNTILSYYDDTTDFLAFETFANPDTQSLGTQANNFSIKSDVRYNLSAGHWLNLGAAVSRTSAQVQFVSSEDPIFYARMEFPLLVDFDRAYHFYAAYLENQSKLTEDLHIRLGARFDYSTLIKDGALSPRFSLWFQVDDRTAIEGSWGVVYQYPDPLAIYTRDPPVALGNQLDNLSAEKAIHYLIGVRRQLWQDVEASFEFYYKDLDRLLLPADEEFFVPQNSGVGVSTGLQFELEKKSGSEERVGGFLSYSYGRSKYREINTIHWISTKYDLRHNLRLLLDLRLWGNWKASFLWQAASGLPYTDIIGVRFKTPFFFGSGADWEFVRGQRNAAWFPFFYRLDARLSYQKEIGDKAFTFYLDFVNLTNHRNIYDIIWFRKTVHTAEKKTYYMLPFIPSFGIGFRL